MTERTVKNYSKWLYVCNEIERERAIKENIIVINSRKFCVVGGGLVEAINNTEWCHFLC
jgi:hypothetical protein